MFGAQPRTGDAGGRRNLRGRKISQRMAIVDESTRQQAAQARLDALENDNDAGDAFAADSDDEEFVMESDEDDGEMSGKKSKKKKTQGTKRKLRGGMPERRAPKSFARLVEELAVDRTAQGTPNYLTAAAGPPQTAATRKFCSVCGNMSVYTCARCGSRYCCRRCYTVHVETRCLKFMA